MAPNLIHDFLNKHIMVVEQTKQHILNPEATIVRERSENGQTKGVAAAFMYGACSVSIAFVNKLLMTWFQYDFPVVIMTVQMLYTILLLKVLSFFSVIHPPKITFQRCKTFALPALCYGINSVLALTALSHMNVAMYGVLKRCVPIATLALSAVVLKKPCPSKLTIVAVFLLTSGCVVAGYGDLKFNLSAYTCGVLSNLTQAMYLLLVQLNCEKQMSTLETLQLNSVNTFPLLAVIAVAKGEFSQALKYSYYHNISFIILFILVLNMGCLLNYSLFLCTSCTCALTTSVVGGIKALAQTLLGLFTFGGVSLNLSTFVGISMNSSGGVMYIYAKYVDNKNKKLHKHLMSVTSNDSSEKLQEEKSPVENGTSHTRSSPV